MIRRVWLTEARRHVGLLTLVAWVVVARQLLFAHPEWAGELLSLATEQRVDVIVLGPIAVALAVWAGGRDRRRGLVDLLATTPSATWRRHIVRWSALTAMLCAGFLVITALGAYYVLGHTTYLGGRWWAVLAPACAGLGALVALGMVIGALVPWRAAAPIAGLATYVGLGVPGYLTYVGDQFLLPNGYESFFVGSQPGLLPTALAMVFFGLVILSLIGVMSAVGRRVIVPAALAALCVGVVAGAQPLAWWVRADPAGAAPVCTTDLPRVCVMRTHAEMLPSVAQVIQPVLTGMGEAAPSEGAREVPNLQSRVDYARLTPLSLYGQIALQGDHLVHPVQLRYDAASSPAIQCVPPAAEQDRDYTWISALELGWTAVVLHTSPSLGRLDAGVWRTLSAASPVEQQDFLGDYVKAGRSCTWSEIGALYEKWTR